MLVVVCLFSFLFGCCLGVVFVDYVCCFYFVEFSCFDCFGNSVMIRGLCGVVFGYFDLFS